jgi:hypothetical protein
MSAIDRKRIAAITALEKLGYRFDGFLWQPPTDREIPGLPDHLDGNALVAIMRWRAETLAGCSENSPEEGERRALVGAVEAYERSR